MTARPGAIAPTFDGVLAGAREDGSNHTPGAF